MVNDLDTARPVPAKFRTGPCLIPGYYPANEQSFPDDWTFSGAKTHAYRQVGNALPVRLAFTVAHAVRRCLV